MINQRFKQFSGLIADCEFKRGAKETKVEDLQGFWDMVYFQVLDLNDSFEHLNKLKDNEWREPEPEPKPQVKTTAAKRTIKVVSKPNANKPVVRSKIREQIMNMKNKRSEEMPTQNESFGEKENKKMEVSIEPLKKSEDVLKKTPSVDKTKEKQSEGVVGTRNVLKRTPLLNAIRK